MNETDLLMKFIAEVPEHIPYARVFRRNIVNAEVSKGGRHFRLKAGIRGQCDAYVYLRGGRVVEVETKAARGAMREAQEAWRAWCLDWQVPHMILKAKTGERPSETVDRWITELRKTIDA